MFGLRAEKKGTTVKEKNLSGSKILQKRLGEFEGSKENNVAPAKRTRGNSVEAGKECRGQTPEGLLDPRQLFWSVF